MKRLISKKTAILLPLTLLSAGLMTPAYANHFHEYTSGAKRNVGSAHNPSADDIRGYLHYPKDSLSLKEEGTVGLKVSLTEEGRVSDAVVVKTSGYPRLDTAAIQVVKVSWRYNPPKNQQMPTDVQTEVTFELE